MVIAFICASYQGGGNKSYDVFAALYELENEDDNLISCKITTDNSFLDKIKEAVKEIVISDPDKVDKIFGVISEILIIINND